MCWGGVKMQKDKKSSKNKIGPRKICLAKFWGECFYYSTRSFKKSILMMSCFYKFEYGEAECRTIYVVNTYLTIVTFSKETYLTQMNERNIPFKGHRTMKEEPQSAYSKFPRSFTLLGPVSCKMKDNGNILVSTSKVKTLITISPLCYP